MTLVQKSLKNQKGLTLIELLAVIVILGIIAAIAVPAIGNIIQDSRDKAAVSEVLNVVSAAKLSHAAGEGAKTGSGATLKITWTAAAAAAADPTNLKNYITSDKWATVTWTQADGYIVKVPAATTLPFAGDGVTALEYTEKKLTDWASGTR